MYLMNNGLLENSGAELNAFVAQAREAGDQARFSHRRRIEALKTGNEAAQRMLDEFRARRLTATPHETLGD